MSRKVMQQALDFCVFCWRDVDMNDYAFERLETTIDALRIELAKPEPVPVAWIFQYDDGDFYEEASVDKEKCERWCVGFEGKAMPLFTKEQL